MTTTLSIVSTAYRATLEEQDDTILWLNHMLVNNGLDIAILLQDNAVNYAVRGQDPSGLRVGSVAVARAPALDEDVTALVEHGVSVYYVREDRETRGIPEASLIDGLKAVTRRELPDLFDSFDRVWSW